MALDIIALRRDTAANWASNNPVLNEGEAGFETDTHVLKLGDGSTTYSNLPITASAGQAFPIVVRVDISAGAGDYSIDPISVFDYTIVDLNACKLNVVSSTADVQLKINSTLVGGILVAATDTRQTTADPATSAAEVTIGDDLKVRVTNLVNSPTILELRVSCLKKVV